MWKGSLLLLLVPLAAGKFEYGSSCRQLECLPKERLIEQLKHYQSQKKRTAVPVVVQTKPRSWPSSRLGQLDELPEDDNPTCNICSSTPCQNGGTCAVDPQSPWNKYTCTCPGNTKGDRCEIPVTCVPETCGPGANCYVSNHQTNCVCPLGYAGNPNDPTVGCSQQIVEACADGDPHYVTFDGFHFDYMGTCPSIFSRPCTSLTGGYADYQVVTKAELVGTTHVSVAHELEVTMYAQKIHMDAEKTLLHNGIAVNPPFYWPSQAAPNITVTFDGSTFTVVNNQYVTVTFSTGGRFCVRVPNVPEFQGPNTLCGLAGNLDGNALNDVVHRDGTVFPVTTEETQARYPPPEKADAFNACEDEWITQEFTSSTASTSCATGQQLSNNTNCDVMPAINTCSAIQQAVNGTGPFGMCQTMGAAQIQNYYDNCVFDLCQQDTLKCHVFENFVKSCQTNLPNTDVGGWRNTEGCPAVCAPGSHYSSCTSSCPATCADQKRPDTCNQGCFEGCECDSGSVVDNTNLMGMSCIPIGQCGCTDPNGNLHPAGQPWLDSNCTILAECLNGTYTSSATECSGYGYCGTDGQHRMACHCLSGFEGDGFNCTDIDECLDSASCGQAQGLGTCTNTIGSYNCTCNPYQYGRDCQVYRPKRHCADLQQYWGVVSDGPQLVYPPYALPGVAAYSAVEVYCDMSQFGGGWTLLSHDSGSGMANRTFDEYSAGFGTGTDRWLGLEFAHQMTELQNTSLLLGKILRCGYGFWDDTVSDCTYPQFTVLDANRSYAVYIPEPCRGTDKQYTGAFDGWVRWDRTQIGPAFQTFDRDTTAPKCSTVHKTVGFWYPTSQKDLCGPANLNGFRTSCSAPAPDQKHLEPFDQYGSVLIADAWMYLRPQDYTPPAASTTLPPPSPPPATDTPAPPAEPVATEAPPPPPAPPVTDAAAPPL